MATKSASTLPNNEAEFRAWATNFIDQVAGHSQLYHLDAERIQQLQAELGEFDSSIADAIRARDTALAATRHKNDLRSNFEDNIRVAIRMIQANDKVTDSAREAAGVHVPKSTRTPVAIPSTGPIGFVMATDRLEHTLSFANSVTPTRRAKPAGVTGCEVYLYIGSDTPQSPSRYTFHMLSTRTPQRITFTDDDAGKTANYLLRWLNTKGQHGPWSQVISATIPTV